MAGIHAECLAYGVKFVRVVRWMDAQAVQECCERFSSERMLSDMHKVSLESALCVGGWVRMCPCICGCSFSLCKHPAISARKSIQVNSIASLDINLSCSGGDLRFIFVLLSWGIIRMISKSGTVFVYLITFCSVVLLVETVALCIGACLYHVGQHAGVS